MKAHSTVFNAYSFSLCVVDCRQEITDIKDTLCLAFPLCYPLGLKSSEMPGCTCIVAPPVDSWMAQLKLPIVLGHSISNWKIKESLITCLCWEIIHWHQSCPVTTQAQSCQLWERSMLHIGLFSCKTHTTSMCIYLCENYTHWPHRLAAECNIKPANHKCHTLNITRLRKHKYYTIL